MKCTLFPNSYRRVISSITMIITQNIAVVNTNNVKNKKDCKFLRAKVEFCLFGRRYPSKNLHLLEGLCNEKESNRIGICFGSQWFYVVT